MDVLFVYPPYERLMGLKVEYFPSNLGCIATILNQNGYDVAVYNAELRREATDFEYSPRNKAKVFGNYKKNLYAEDHEVWNEVESVIKENKPKIVGITSNVATHTAVLRVAKTAKEIAGCTVVIGGPYPTLLPEEACRSEYVDYVVWGEGEYTMLELTNFILRNQGALREIKGVVFKVAGECIKTPKRERITDLDSLPYVNRDLFLSISPFRKSSHTIMGSRGCPHRCSFCAVVPIWGRKVVYRSAGSLVNEIETNHEKYKNKGFRFYDDVFTASVRRATEFSEKLVERRLHKKLTWGCLSRVNVISRELVRSLERANCRSIALGIESGSDRILKTLKKDITKSLVREKVKIVRNSKLSLHLYFMVGTPYEKEEDILETYSFVRELSPDSIGLCTFTPYYGTELYNTCVSRGTLPEKHDVSMYEEIGLHNKYNYYCDIPRDRYFELVEMMMSLSDEISHRITRRRIVEGLSYCLNHPIGGVRKIKEKVIESLRM